MPRRTHIRISARASKFFLRFALDLLDLFDLPTVVGQLSCLADSMVTICLELVSAQTGIASNGFVVIAQYSILGVPARLRGEIGDLILYVWCPTE